MCTLFFCLQEGSAEKLYESVWSKILSLPDNTILYPAHDYKGIIVQIANNLKNIVQIASEW